jgi:hypothetical protein
VQNHGWAKDACAYAIAGETETDTLATVEALAVGSDRPHRTLS